MSPSRHGRYSFFGADPFKILHVPFNGKKERTTALPALQELDTSLEKFRSEKIQGLPPFQGGAAGLMGYEMAHSFEKLPVAPDVSFPMPSLLLGFYDVICAIDHLQGKSWLISHGFPETKEPFRTIRAKERLDSFKKLLVQRESPVHFTGTLPSFVPPEEKLFPTAVSGVYSNFSKEGYLEAVRQIIEEIYCGEIFQANLSQTLFSKQIEVPSKTYLRLRKKNPAPFAAYFQTPEFSILSSSPERLCSVHNGCVETRPIKGTRPLKLTDELYSSQQRYELLRSTKDRAENTMIVDLLRNDLSKICLPESVTVTEYCQLEEYQHVLHLVSAVVGKLRPNASAAAVVSAIFPGGSITGAPKIRAMEIITEHEKRRRGAYCGSIGYFGFEGTIDMNILIRTITISSGWLQYSVGGGITANSTPEEEYAETWAKAAGLIRSLPDYVETTISCKAGQVF